MPLVASFETGFHRTIPEANQRYAVPDEWATKHGIRRWGFHGASHRYIAGRMAELLGRDDLKLISCHLGGSSSTLRHQERQVDRDQHGDEPADRPAAKQPRRRLRRLRPAGDPEVDGPDARPGARHPGQPLGPGRDRRVGRDLRDIEAAAKDGNEKAKLALDVYIASARHYLGAYLVDLGGADAIVFTGGIGENSTLIREGVCRRSRPGSGSSSIPTSERLGIRRAGRLDEPGLAFRSGPCRPTRKSSSPGRPATCSRD